MKPSEVRKFVLAINPMFNNKLVFTHEKKDGSFSVVLNNHSRVLNVEKLHTGEYAFKFYPFIDFSEGQTWAERDASYATYNTITCKRLERSKYVGEQAEAYLSAKKLMGHRNNETTFGVFILDEFNEAEFGALMSMVITAHGEQYVYNSYVESKKAEAAKKAKEVKNTSATLETTNS